MKRQQWAVTRALLVLSLMALIHAAGAQTGAPANSSSEERHLHHIRQLTFGGQNAEAYFSPDGKQLIFQSTREPFHCDQIFTMNLDGSDQKLVSTGKGRTTCSYFFADGKRILYSSTHLGSPECPPKPDYSRGYVWAIYPSFDIFTANADGSDVKQLTNTPGYDAEATLSTDGKKIVFTSVRNGDLDIYTMDADGKHVKQLTHELGYDGGPFFSPDGKLIVYRAHHPKTRAGDPRLQRIVEAEPDPANVPRDLADECRRESQTANHESGSGELCPVILS